MKWALWKSKSTLRPDIIKAYEIGYKLRSVSFDEPDSIEDVHLVVHLELVAADTDTAVDPSTDTPIPGENRIVC